MEVVGLFLLFASPALIVAGLARLGATRRRLTAIATVIIASLAPALIIFIATLQADAITNAAAYAIVPVFCVYGLFVAAVALAMISAFTK